jgi:predicted DNA-binding protein
MIGLYSSRLCWKLGDQISLFFNTYGILLIRELYMRFVVEMDDEQYRRLEKNLEKSGTALTEAITDFFDDLDDANVAEERLSEIASGEEHIIPWEQIRVAL